MQLGRWRLFAAAGAALTLFTATGRLSAQGTITGKVTSQSGGQPLAEARIIVIGGTGSAVTNEEGKFTLRNLAAGNVQLQVLRVGFQSQKKIVSVASGSMTVADFALPVAIAQLERGRHHGDRSAAQGGARECDLHARRRQQTSRDLRDQQRDRFVGRQEPRRQRASEPRAGRRADASHSRNLIDLAEQCAHLGRGWRSL